MPFDIVKHHNCHIIKHDAATLDRGAIDATYNELADLSRRNCQTPIICDMTRATGFHLNDEDLEYFEPAMMYLFSELPEQVKFIVAVNDEKMKEKISLCHQKIRDCGFPHFTRVVDSLEEAIELL